jgi:hypothetical protein
MEEELEIDPQRLAMEQVIGVLKPLRQHRQASAERAQRKAQQALDDMQVHLQQTRDALSQERINQRERRQALSDTHLNTGMSLDTLQCWQGKEQRMLDRLADPSGRCATTPGHRRATPAPGPGPGRRQGLATGRGKTRLPGASPE